MAFLGSRSAYLVVIVLDPVGLKAVSCIFGGGPVVTPWDVRPGVEMMGFKECHSVEVWLGGTPGGPIYKE